MPALKPGSSLATGSAQTGARTPAPENERIFSQELIGAFANHYWLLLLGPILIALVSYLTVAVAPAKYTSIAFLRIDRATARSVEALMTSPALADKVLSQYPEAGANSEERVRYIGRNLGLSDVEPSSDRVSVRLFRLEFSSWDARMAQSVATRLIDAWLNTTLPAPVERANLEADLERNKIAAASNTALIDKLQKEATTLIIPNSMSGEIATPISALITKRDTNLTAIQTIENRLRGMPRDVIVEPPHLPAETSSRRVGAAFLSGVAAVPLLLAVILLCRFLAPGMTLRAGISSLLRRRAA